MSLPNTSVGVFDARTRFFELLERIEAGEEVTIMRHGKPVARLVPPAPVKTKTTSRAERTSSAPMSNLPMSAGWGKLALS